MPRHTVESIDSTKDRALPNLHVRTRETLVQDATSKGRTDAGHAFPDEDIGETCPPGARFLVAHGQADVATVARFAQDQIRHDKQAAHHRRVRRNQQQDRANQLAERLHGKQGIVDKEEQRTGRSDPDRQHEGRLHLSALTVVTVIAVAMVGEAVLNKLVFDLLGAGSRETWLFTIGMGAALMWAAHHLGAQRRVGADSVSKTPIKSGVLPVLLLSMAGCIVMLGLLRAVAFRNDQEIIKQTVPDAFVLDVATAAVMFGFIQLLFNGVAYAVGYLRHAPGVEAAKRARASRWWARVRLSYSKSRLARRQRRDEQSFVLLAAHYREFVAWARDILESYATALEAYYDAFTGDAEPQRAAVLADQTRLALKAPDWLDEFERAAKDADPLVDELIEPWKAPPKPLNSVPPSPASTEEKAA